MYEHTFPEERFEKTLAFLEKWVSKEQHILDLGVPNPFSEIIKSKGYRVDNTTGEDLDDHFEAVQTSKYDCVTAFEIFEHLLAPYNVLKHIEAPNDQATFSNTCFYKCMGLYDTFYPARAAKKNIIPYTFWISNL